MVSSHFYTYRHTHHSSNPLRARQSLRQTLVAAVAHAILYMRRKDLFTESMAPHLPQACVRPCKLDYPPHHNIVEKHCLVCRRAPSGVVVSLWIPSPPFNLTYIHNFECELTFDDVADVYIPAPNRPKFVRWPALAS